MEAYLFPGQGSQYPQMGLPLYEKHLTARQWFQKADHLLGFSITSIMFEGTEADLKRTDVTQPAIFLHSVILSQVMGASFRPDMAAGHSLGEFSALAATGAVGFEDGLRLVSKRAAAMQKACEGQPGTMAAILGLEDEVVERVCASVHGVVKPANYNCPGQVVISGEVAAVNAACEALKAAGAKRALVLPVGGAFDSPLMDAAREELADAIERTVFKKPVCPVYQNVTTTGITDPDTIKKNLIVQLTSPVRWAQSIWQMLQDGATAFTEVGPGRVLQGLVRKIDGNAAATSIDGSL